MGQTLSEPVTDKESSSCQDDKLKVGSSCMQGWRINMEDAHTHILSLPEDPDSSFLAVYDGHGGAKVAQHAAKHLHKYILNRPEYKDGKISLALQQGFLDLDQAMLEEESLRDEMAGSTAVIVLIKDETIYCANVGDSRAIASLNGQVVALSEDHKPCSFEERARIVAAGGWVEFNRVNGNLALSRALGDFVFKRNERISPKEQIVTAFPDIKTMKITSDLEFVLLACDGIWDVMGTQEACDFVRVRLSTGMEPEIICEELMTRCLSPDCHMGGLGCDNMTVVLACFLHGDSFSHLVARCAQPRPIITSS